MKKLTDEDVDAIIDEVMCYAIRGAMEFSRTFGCELDGKALVPALRQYVRDALPRMLRDVKCAMDAGMPNVVDKIKETAMWLAGLKAADSITSKECWPEK